jgi:hypothetical protein
MAADSKQFTINDFPAIGGMDEKNGKLVISRGSAFQAFLSSSEPFDQLLREGKCSFFPDGRGVNTELSVDHNGHLLPKPDGLCLSLVDLAVKGKKLEVAKVLVELYGATPTDRYNIAVIRYNNAIVDAAIKAADLARQTYIGTQRAQLRDAFNSTLNDESKPMSAYTFFGEISDVMGERQKFVDSLNRTQSLDEARKLVDTKLKEKILSRELRTKVEAVGAKIAELAQPQNEQRVGLQRK